MDDPPFRDIRRTTTPQGPPGNRPILLVWSWLIGVVMTAVVVAVVYGLPNDTAPTVVIPAATTDGHIASLVEAMATEAAQPNLLQFPTPTPRPTDPVVSPTATGRSNVNDCTNRRPGEVCQVPPLPTATPSPIPVCTEKSVPLSFCRKPYEWGAWW